MSLAVGPPLLSQYYIDCTTGGHTPLLLLSLLQLCDAPPHLPSLHTPLELRLLDRRELVEAPAGLGETLVPELGVCGEEEGKGEGEGEEGATMRRRVGGGRVGGDDHNAPSSVGESWA